MQIDLNHVSNGTAVSQETIVACVREATATRPLDPSILLAIIISEGGRKGMVKANANNSYDLGVAQINTIQFHEPWFVNLHGNDWQTLANDVCESVDAAADILLRRMSELPVGSSIWDAVGHYNSKTGEYKMSYLQRVMQIYTATAINNGGQFKIDQRITDRQKNFFASD